MSEFRIEQDVAVVTLDDGKANAVGHAFVDSVNAGLDQALDSASAVVIAGRAGVFSAGFDLKEFEKGPDATRALVDKGAQMLLRVFSHPQPVVAACTGHGVAAGALLLLAADTRIGTLGEYRLGLNETAIGMPLPEFGLQLAAARLSMRHQTAAVIQARLFTPAEAVDAGFLDVAVDEGETLATAMTHAAALAKLPADAYAGNKRASRATYIEKISASLQR